MSNSKYIINLYLGNFFKSIINKNSNGKRKINSILINTLLFTLPILTLLIFKGKILKSIIPFPSLLTMIFLFYISFLLFISTKKIISNLFFAEDIEIYLSLPIKLRDILIAKIFEINFDILFDSFFIILSSFSVFFLYKVNFTFYFFTFVVFIITNFLFTLWIYIFSILYFKLKSSKKLIKYTFMILLVVSIFIFKSSLFYILKSMFLLNLISNSFFVYFVISLMLILLGFLLFFKSYKSTLFNINIHNQKIKKSKKLKSKNTGLIKSLALKDLKKIIGNPSFRLGLIFGTLMYALFLFIMTPLLQPIFKAPNGIVTSFIFLTMLLPSMMFFASRLPQILFSIDSPELDFISSLPIPHKDILKSKFLVAAIINIPSFLITILNFIFIYKTSILLILLMSLSTILTCAAFIMIAFYYDLKNINLFWFNSKELIEDYNKLFKILSFSLISQMPFYILSTLFKGNYILLIIPTLIHIFYMIKFYKKIIILSKDFYLSHIQL